MAENIEEAFELEHFFPEVARPVTGFVLRIARATLHFAGMTSAIEGKKIGLHSFEPGRHVDLVRIGGKMDERPLFEIE